MQRAGGANMGGEPKVRACMPVGIAASGPRPGCFMPYHRRRWGHILPSALFCFFVPLQPT